MSTVKDLYQLQETDLEIDEKRATLATVEGQLGESEAVLEAKQRIAEKRQSLKALEDRQREEEWPAQELQAKVKAVEDKLYGGSVKIPRELSDMTEELEHLKARQRERDDTILGLMSEGEELQREIEHESKELRRMEADWHKEQRRLLRERDQLMSAVAALEERRSAEADTIDGETLALYESLRLSKQRVAVAKVERGMCQGCRISLSMNDLRKAQLGRGLVNCGSCGRILYMS
ncbi:MAG: hypothetical protein ABIH46_05575 [Chloroflexota bacterium]